MSSAKDVAPLENGQMKLVAPRTINVKDVVLLENGQQRLGLPLMSTALTSVQQEDGLLQQV